MDFTNTLFRCSQLGNLMTEPRSKSETLSETCKKYLIDVFVAEKYNRQSDIQNKYIEKGLAVEEDSITLYSRLQKRFFKKNDRHLHNDFIKGTPDLYTGLEIVAADEVIDIKSSWDIFTFFRVHTQDINKLYYWQLQGYMALAGASIAKLVYCLVNTPRPLIDSEKRRLMWNMGAYSDDDPLYVKACEEMERSMIFDDIAMEQRVIEYEISRCDADIEKIFVKVKQAREYLNQLERSINPQWILAEYEQNLQIK